MFLDDEDKLNKEEKAFVEDPANADLFDDPPPGDKKRSTDDQPAVSVVAKKRKTSDSEVKVKQNLIPNIKYNTMDDSQNSSADGLSLESM